MSDNSWVEPFRPEKERELLQVLRDIEDYVAELGMPYDKSETEFQAGYNKAILDVLHAFDERRQ